MAPVVKFISSQAQLLVEQFHHVLKQGKLDEPGTFVRFQYADAAEPQANVGESGQAWFCVGSMQKMRPVILHALVHLIPAASSDEESEKVLRLETVGEGAKRAARISTSHQALHSLYAQRADRSEDIAVSVWRSLPAKSSRDLGNHFVVHGDPDVRDVLGPSFSATVQQKASRAPSGAA